MINLVTPLIELISGFKSLISRGDKDSLQENFFEALRLTLSEREDFKGSILEIHPIHSRSDIDQRSMNSLALHSYDVVSIFT